MPVILFTDQVFTFLHDKVMEKYFLYCSSKGYDPTLFKAFEKYGYEASSNPSLLNALVDDPKSGKYLKENSLHINGNYLYKRYRDTKKKTTGIKVSAEYLQLFLLFIGYQSKEELLETSMEISDNDKAIQLRIWGSKIDTVPLSLEILKFQGAFYNLQHNNTREFTLNIDVTSNRKNGGTPEHISRAYAASAKFIFGRDIVDYYGLASKTGSYLYINLWSEEKNTDNVRGATFVLHQGPSDLREVSFLSGSYSAVTKQGHIIAGETLLYRCDDVDPNYREKLDLGLRRYIFLKGNQIWFKQLPFTGFYQLSQESYPENARAFKNLVGNNRIFSLEAGNKLAISSLKISSDYQINYKTYNGKYLGHFSLSEGKRVVLISFTNKANLVVEIFLTLNLFPNFDFLGENDMFYMGNVQFLGQSGEYLSSKCVLQKVEEEEEPKLINGKDIPSTLLILSQILAFLTDEEFSEKSH